MLANHRHEYIMDQLEKKVAFKPMTWSKSWKFRPQPSEMT